MHEPLDLTTYVVHQWNCDHFGHLNVRHYAAAFDDAIFIFWARMGHVPRHGGAYPVSVELKIGFKHEALAGMITDIACRVVKVGGKSVGLQFEMKEKSDQTVLAVCDVVEVFVDPDTRQSCAIPAAHRAEVTLHICPAEKP